MLQSLILPSTVEVVRDCAFLNCASLQEAILSSHLREIQENAFSGCSALQRLHLPPMIEKLKYGAFRDTPILNDVYVYLANPKDIAITQDTFSCWKSATLHVPSFGFSAYYYHPQWGQFAHIARFDEDYDTFYTKNTITLDHATGTIPDTPDALLYEHGSLVVNDDEKQNLGEVDLNHDGKDGASLIPEQDGNINIKHLNVKISVQANRWYFFCFPFDVPLDDVKYGGYYIWRQYDGEKRSRREGGWQDLAAGTTKLEAGRGYIFQGNSSSVLHLNIHEPEIHCGNASTALNEYVGANTLPADNNWNFVGNPYVSYYAVDETTYAAPIIVWTGYGYEAYRPGDDDYEFAPYLAFFVQSGNGKNAVNFSADNREGYEQAQETQSNRRMDVPMLLVDDVMETTFDLRNGAYEFSSAKGTFNKRFYLKRYEGFTTSIKDLADQIGMTFSISDGSISVEGLDATTRVSLYNTAGQQIATQQGNGTITAIPGTYVISVGKLAAKVVVK